jgi:hypothetical protein
MLLQAEPKNRHALLDADNCSLADVNSARSFSEKTDENRGLLAGWERERFWNERVGWEIS